jgi:hypothetical protein
VVPVDVSVLDAGGGLFELIVICRPEKRRTAQSTHPPPIPVPFMMSNVGLVPGLPSQQEGSGAARAAAAATGQGECVELLQLYGWISPGRLQALGAKSDKPVGGIAGIGVPNADVVAIAANLGGGDQLRKDAVARGCGNARTQLGRAHAKEDRLPQGLCHVPLMAANNDLVNLMDRNSASPKAIQLRSFAACRAPA